MFIPRSVKRKYDHIGTSNSAVHDAPTSPVKKRNDANAADVAQGLYPETRSLKPVVSSSFPSSESSAIGGIDTATEPNNDEHQTAIVDDRGTQDGSFIPQSESDEEPIKLFSSEQRLVIPGQDEPVCVICGKYGEYINDATENDVCSLECKRIDIDLHGGSAAAPPKSPEVRKIPHHGVADNLHAKLTNYQEAPEVANLSRSQVESILKAHEIKVKGSRVPNPIASFDQCSQALGATVLQNLDRMGWSMAKGVQKLAVPAMLAGRDVTALAPAGSGKTAAYALPILAHCQSLSTLHRHKRRCGPYALILAPTHDMCVQIEKTIKQLAQGVPNLRTGLLIGGQPWPDQIHRLRKGVQIVVGTPGRVFDMATYHPHMLRIWRMRIVVLDEADTLFGQGLREQVRKVMGKLMPGGKIVRQTALFSATATNTQENERMCRRLIQPIDIRVQQLDEKAEARAIKKLLRTNPNVRQTILWVENPSKGKRLLSILEDPKYFTAPALVFVESRLAAEYLTRSIKKRRQCSHWRVVAMHGDLSQEERSEIIASISGKGEPEWDVVISTDILARGVNLPRVKLVINYDMAKTLDGYVQRIAQAAVPESTDMATGEQKHERGWAITFINNDHKHLLPTLAKLLANKSPVEVTPLPIELKRYLQ